MIKILCRSRELALAGLLLAVSAVLPVLAQSMSNGPLSPMTPPSGAAPAQELPQSMREASVEVDRLSEIAEKEGDLRTRGMLAWRNPVPSFPAGSAQIAALAPAALLSDDPIVAMLFATGCDAPEIGCDGLALATRWTQLDGDNSAAWLTLWQIDSRLGDTAGAEAALAQSVASSQWRDYSVELTNAYVHMVPDDAEILVRLVARLEAPPRVVGIVNALYRSALGLCRLPSKREACMAITDTISRQPVSLLQATVSASLSQHFGAPEAVTVQRRERVEAWQWAIAQGQPSGLLSSNPRANAGEVIAYIEQLDAAGEGAAAEQVLAQDRLSRAEAASRYRASRSVSQGAPRPAQLQSGPGLRLPSQ